MAIPLGAFLRIIDKQLLFEQPVFNVYHYRVVSVTGIEDGTLGEVLEFWVDHMMDEIRGIQHPNVLHQTVEIYDLTGGTQFATQVLNLNGTNSAEETECAPSFVCASFMLNRSSLLTRNGWKRYAGIAEGYINGNVTEGFSTSATPLAEKLGEDVYGGIVQLLEPVIIKHPLVVPLPTSHGYNSIDSAVFKHIGSQVSRKNFIGASII